MTKPTERATARNGEALSDSGKKLGDVANQIRVDGKLVGAETGTYLERYLRAFSHYAEQLKALIAKGDATGCMVLHATFFTALQQALDEQQARAHFLNDKPSDPPGFR